MATADIEETLPKTDWGHKLFSMQFCGQLIMKIVKIDSVVQKFIDCDIISEEENKSLRDKKVPDQKLRCLLTIITEYCNRNDLQAFKSFIDILGDTHNVEIAHQLSLIYDERVNYASTLSQLSKEKVLVGKLKNELKHLLGILEEKEGYLERLTDEKEKLIDHYRKVADNQDETFRKEKLSLEQKIKIKEEDLLSVKTEVEELTRAKNKLENDVEHILHVIHKREEEIAEKGRKVGEAIEESNRLRIEIDTLKQLYNKEMVENKEELSKKIEILEVNIAEKENKIMNLRKKQTMTREEIEEELRNITKGQEKKLDDQTAMAKQQNKKIDDQTAIIKQQNKKIDVLTDTVERVVNLLEKK